MFSELTIMFALVENNLKKYGLRIFSKARNEFCGICEALSSVNYTLNFSTK